MITAIAVLIAAASATGLTPDVSLVRNGEANADIVIADQPKPVARYAAEELAWHVEKATGVRLDIVPESHASWEVHTRVYVGETSEAMREGIDAARLPRETYVLRSVGNDLFIVGREDDADPLDANNPNAGTLFGVYALLEESMGVRWLWPGELGTFVPRTETIEVAAINRTAAPALQFRELEWSPIRRFVNGPDGYEDADARLGFSPDVLVEYANALNVFLRRHRMGGMDAQPPTGHTFAGWWKQLGREHPEWFMLRYDGLRGNPDPEFSEVELCVTNEELQDYILSQWDGNSWLRLGSVDRPGRCTCDTCRAWDGPQPESPPWFARMMYEGDNRTESAYAGPTSDRYARFWKVMQEKAAKQNPNVRVSGSFLFENQFTAPVLDIQLNKNIYAEFVQWQDPHLRWFPMPDEALKWMQEQWLGWKRTGIRMGYRPNYLHDGYVMPYFDTRQSGEFFRFAHRHGMEGARFDSLTGQWATQGLRLYVHLRLMTAPETEIDVIRDEFFSAFGPAAGTIEEYYDYWEAYSVDNVLRFIDLFQNPFVGWRYRAYPLKAHLAFPPEVFAPAQALLDRARAEAEGDARPEYAERVRFVEAGLQHALLTARLAALFDGNNTFSEERAKEGIDALRTLVQFRKKHERLFFADLHRVTNFWERPKWEVDPLLPLLVE